MLKYLLKILSVLQKYFFKYNLFSLCKIYVQIYLDHQKNSYNYLKTIYTPSKSNYKKKLFSGTSITIILLLQACHLINYELNLSFNLIISMVIDFLNCYQTK